jgi:hypothetical protein
MAFDPILTFSATLKIKKAEFLHSTFVNRHSSFPWFVIRQSTIDILTGGDAGECTVIMNGFEILGAH